MLINNNNIIYVLIKNINNLLETFFITVGSNKIKNNSFR